MQRRELHGRVHHGRGRLGRHFLRGAHSHRHRRRGHAYVHRGRVRQLAEHQRRGQRGPAELRHRNHGQHTHHQQHGQRRELHHGGRRVHGDTDGLAASFAATGALTGATLTITGAASAGPLDCESLDRTFTATSGGASTGSVVCGDVTSLGTISAPQLFASNTLTATNPSNFSDDLFLTKNWAGWSKQQQRGPRQRPGAAAAGQPERACLPGAERRGAPCELIMINDEALVQTKPAAS